MKPKPHGGDKKLPGLSEMEAVLSEFRQHVMYYQAAPGSLSVESKQIFSWLYARAAKVPDEVANRMEHAVDRVFEYAAPRLAQSNRDEKGARRA